MGSKGIVRSRTDPAPWPKQGEAGVTEGRGFMMRGSLYVAWILSWFFRCEAKPLVSKCMTAGACVAVVVFPVPLSRKRGLTPVCLVVST